MYVHRSGGLKKFKLDMIQFECFDRIQKFGAQKKSVRNSSKGYSMISE
jgi:hypothetical protein